MTKPTIKTVTPSSADQAVGTIVLAFSGDPIARWFYPDPHQYLLHLPSFVRAFAGKAFGDNSAFYIDGYLGAALWLPRASTPTKRRCLRCFKARFQRRTNKKSLPLWSRWIAPIRPSLTGICL